MEWQPCNWGGQRRGALGPMGKPLAGHIFPCAYCQGTGTQVHMQSQCPVCRGKGVNRVNPQFGVAVVCAFCRGGGEATPRSHITCPACRGRGIMVVKEPFEGCDLCRGRGRVTSTQLPCMKCQGAGVFTGKRKAQEPKGVGLWTKR